MLWRAKLCGCAAGSFGVATQRAAVAAGLHQPASVETGLLSEEDKNCIRQKDNIHVADRCFTLANV